MAIQCVLVGKGKDDVFTAVYGETTFDKVLKAYNEDKVIQVIYQNRTYYLDNTTVISSPEAFSFISSFSNQNDENGEIKHYVITLMSGDNWSGPFLQKSTPATHAKTHVKNGTDPLAPADIGAMELSESVLKQSNEDITSQVAQALSGDLIPFSGGTMTGLLNVLTPVGDSNATTKKYVDDALSKKIGMDGIGDLHVWKKTVVNSQAGYDLYPVESNIALASGTESGRTGISFLYSASVSVDTEGQITLVSPTSVQVYHAQSAATPDLSGKFVKITELLYSDMSSDYVGKILYVPTGGVMTRRSGAQIILTLAQEVAGHGAGTTVTYPVSTNRNAYQEGSDAKPAGYTLGDVVTGNFELAFSANNPRQFKVAESVTVDEVGNITLNSPVTYFFYTNNTGNSRDLIKGKFLTRTDASPSWVKDGAIYYIPNDAVISYVSTRYEIDRYQPVTGYAAIPANTTIEYLGGLGEKTRIQVVSYVGTGTYGKDNPCSLTFDFVPKIVIIINQIALEATMIMQGQTEYSSSIVGKNYRGSCNLNGKTLTYYNISESSYQMNGSDNTYLVLAIG